MSELTKLVGPHGTIAFATAEKAERLIRIQGYKRVDEEEVPEVEVPKPRRGRQKKV